MHRFSCSCTAVFHVQNAQHVDSLQQQRGFTCYPGVTIDSQAPAHGPCGPVSRRCVRDVTGQADYSGSELLSSVDWLIEGDQRDVIQMTGAYAAVVFM